MKRVIILCQKCWASSHLL